MSNDTCPFFKRPCRKRANIRKSDEHDQNSDRGDLRPIPEKTKRTPQTLISAKTTKTSDQRRVLPEFNLSSDKTAESTLPRDMGAAAHIESETPVGQDKQAQFERTLKLNRDLKHKESDNVYRGMVGYQQFYEHEDKTTGNASSGRARTRGPIRAPVNIRVTTRWDYQPDICKDYKETGFCGFGDSCKFLHDRTEYKFGWELERDETTNKADEHHIESSDPSDSEEDDDDIPENCPYCRGTFENPIKTKCGHYFCEKCALAHFKRTTRCMKCGEDTEGKFKPAQEILDKIKNAKKIRDSNDDDEGGDAVV